MKSSLVTTLAVLTVALCLSGCLGLHFGGGSHTRVQNTSDTYNVSEGQQLMDLQKAYEGGVITEAEYNSQKKRILKYYLKH